MLLISRGNRFQCYSTGQEHDWWTGGQEINSICRGNGEKLAMGYWIMSVCSANICFFYPSLTLPLSSCSYRFLQLLWCYELDLFYYSLISFDSYLKDGFWYLIGSKSIFSLLLMLNQTLMALLLALQILCQRW